MRAKHVMTRQVHSVAADSSVYDAAQVLLNAGISAAPVVDADGTLIGVVSEARQSDANTYKSVLVVPWVDLGSFANVVILTGSGTS